MTSTIFRLEIWLAKIKCTFCSHNTQGIIPSLCQRPVKIHNFIKVDQVKSDSNDAFAKVDLMIRRSMPGYVTPFQVVEYSVNNEDEKPTASRIERWKLGAAGDYTNKVRMPICLL